MSFADELNSKAKHVQEDWIRKEKMARAQLSDAAVEAVSDFLKAGMDKFSQIADRGEYSTVLKVPYVDGMRCYTEEQPAIRLMTDWLDKLGTTHSFLNVSQYGHRQVKSITLDDTPTQDSHVLIQVSWR